MIELAEWHKRDDVPQDRLSFRRAKDSIISVQSLHISKVSVSHANDDDGHGQVGGVNDGLSSVRHVRNHTVRQDQEDEVLLQKERERERKSVRYIEVERWKDVSSRCVITS